MTDLPQCQGSIGWSWTVLDLAWTSSLLSVVYDDLMQTSATHAVSISIDLSGQPSGAFVLAAQTL